MRSVADDVREEQLRETLALTPGERVRIALQLGEQAVAVYMAAHGVDRGAAISALRRASRAGRTPSKCHDES